MACKSCNVIINELLSFVQNKINVIEDDRLILICIRGFNSSDIQEAVDVLSEVFPKEIILTPKIGKDSSQWTIREILRILKTYSASEVPIFVARNLSRLPPLAFDQTGVTRLLKDIVALRAELDELQKTPAFEVIQTVQQEISLAINDTNAAVVNVTEEDFSPPLVDYPTTVVRIEAPILIAGNHKCGKRNKLSHLKPKQLIEFREAFRLFDKDGDGTITKEELGRVMRSLGQFARVEELHDMLQEVDSDGDGNVSFEEFVSILSKSMHGAGSGTSSAEQEERELRDAFRVFDKHNRGYICASDLRAVLQCLGEDLSEEEIEDMIKEVDSDGDGRIDFLEFVRALGEPEDACDDDEDEDATDTPDMPLPRPVPAI